MTAAAFDKVFRFLNPAHLRGKRCRIAAPSPLRRDHNGRVQINDGACLVAIEFEDGTRAAFPQQALYSIDSKAGRQVLAKLARGGARDR